LPRIAVASDPQHLQVDPDEQLEAAKDVPVRLLVPRIAAVAPLTRAWA